MNVYVPPHFEDSFTDIYLPIAKVLETCSIANRIVAGDFNARIGDITTAGLDDDFTHVLPPANYDQTLNDGRAPFLAFLDLSDLHLLNGNYSVNDSAPEPADFTFLTIREQSSSTGASQFIFARSCIDFILTDSDTFSRIIDFDSTFFPQVEHCLHTISLPLHSSQFPPSLSSAISLQKFIPPPFPVHAAIFEQFKLERVPSNIHPMSHLINLIHAAGSWRPLRASKSWFSNTATVEQANHVASLRKEVRRLFASLLLGGSDSLFREFIVQRTAWIKALDDERKLSTATFQSTLNEWLRNPAVPGNASKLWKILTGKKSDFGNPLISEDRLVVHFEALLRTQEPLAYSPSDPPIIIPRLDDPFEPTEVAAVIRQKRSSSAPGEDQLQYSFWKEVIEDPLSLTRLTDLFNFIFTTGSVPQDWRKSIVSMLYKGKGARDLPTNFRAISLTATSLKIFETLISNRLASWAESQAIFSYHQAGFRRNYSTQDHVFALSALQQASGKGKSYVNTYVAFVDLAKAFPSISRPLLIKKLQMLGVSTKIVNMVAALYESDQYQFLLSRSSLGSQVGTANRGTREGSCLSPLLFLLFVSDLPKFLEGAHSLAPAFGQLLLRVLQFADDTALIAIGRANLQRLLDRFEEYCALNGLTINGGKTEIINLRQGARGSRKDRWKIAGSIVSISVKARYLGVIFGTGRKGLHHTRNLRAKKPAKSLGTCRANSSGRVYRFIFSYSTFSFSYFIFCLLRSRSSFPISYSMSY